MFRAKRQPMHRELSFPLLASMPVERICRPPMCHTVIWTADHQFLLTSEGCDDRAAVRDSNCRSSMRCSRTRRTARRSACCTRTRRRTTSCCGSSWTRSQRSTTTSASGTRVSRCFLLRGYAKCRACVLPSRLVPEHVATSSRYISQHTSKQALSLRFPQCSLAAKGGGGLEVQHGVHQRGHDPGAAVPGGAHHLCRHLRPAGHGQRRLPAQPAGVSSAAGCTLVLAFAALPRTRTVGRIRHI